MNVFKEKQRNLFLMITSVSDYKSCLDSIHILTLTLCFELQGNMSIIKRLQDPSDTTAIFVGANFSGNGARRSRRNFGGFILAVYGHR